MRCPICDFCGDQEMSMYGLSHGYLPDGVTRNTIDPRSGLCQLCLLGAQVPFEKEQLAILDEDEGILDKEWDAF